MVTMRAATHHIANANQLGPALAAIRDELGWSQTELAEWTGLNRTYLSGLESETPTTAVQRLITVINTLGYEISLSPIADTPTGDW